MCESFRGWSWVMGKRLANVAALIVRPLGGHPETCGAPRRPKGMRCKFVLEHMVPYCCLGGGGGNVEAMPGPVGQKWCWRGAIALQTQARQALGKPNAQSINTRATPSSGANTWRHKHNRLLRRKTRMIWTRAASIRARPRHDARPGAKATTKPIFKAVG